MMWIRSVAFLVGLVACNALSGANDYDESRTPVTNRDGGGGTEGGPAEPGSPVYRRPIAMTSDLGESPSAYPVLVTFPASFDYGKTRPDGSDLRFSRSEARTDDLAYWIERWAPGERSAVWVLVPAVPIGQSQLHVFYGNTDGAAVSGFDKVFKSIQKTTGGGAGSFTATGNIDVDWFELSAGDTLTLVAGVPLEIRARRIIVNGSVDGNAKGYAGGISKADPSGKGPGGGKAKTDSGGGGGGYGGAGGEGGADGTGTGGLPGIVNGSEIAIDMGSGGGAGVRANSATHPAAAGGGAISLFGWSITVRGTISVHGQSVETAASHAGGGAGGGILVAGSSLDLAGALFGANGGNGGMPTNADGDGGGGGGGGRINLHARSTGLFEGPAAASVAFGVGGTTGGTTAPGDPGNVGVVHIGNEASLVPGVVASLGDEVSVE